MPWLTRRGELFSLTRADIDFPKVRIHIRPREAADDLPPFKPNLLHADFHVVLTHRQYDALKARWRSWQEQDRPWAARDVVNNLPRRFRQDLKKADIERRPGDYAGVPYATEVCRKELL